MKHSFKKMPFLLLALFLWITSWPSQAQVTLNPSEDWNFHFVLENDWLDVGPTLTVPPGGANGHFAATLNTDLPSGTVLRCELYEGRFFGAPTDGQSISTFLYTSSPPNTITGWVASAWQDREGIIRFTALNGPAMIELLDLEVNTPLTLSYWYYHYLSIVPPAMPPRLRISYSSGLVQLSWWTNVSPGYVLEAANAVTGASWSAASASSTISNAQRIVTLSTNGTDLRFFRLRK